MSDQSVHPGWLVTSYRPGDAQMVPAGYEDEAAAREDALHRATLQHTEISLWKLAAEVRMNPSLVEPTP